MSKGRALAYNYLRSISLAFFDFYLNQKQEFEPYLTDFTVQNMGQNPLALGQWALP